MLHEPSHATQAVPPKTGLFSFIKMRPAIVLAALTASTPLADAFLFCQNATAAVCRLENVVVHLSGPVILETNDTYEIINSVIVAQQCTADPCFGASVSVTTTGNITFLNSSLTAAVISLSAAYVSLDNASVVSASGQGPPTTDGPFGQADGRFGTGGGHGGTGAAIYLCRAGVAPNPPSPNGQGFGFASRE